MEFKYATSILFSNMGYILKILLWILLCVVLTAAIGAAIFIPTWNVAVANTDVMTGVNAIREAANLFMDGQTSIRTLLDSLASGFSAAVSSIASAPGIMTGIVFTVLFLYLLYSFLMGLSYYPVADIVNKLMSSNLRFGFASNMALNFKAACRFSGAKLLVALPMDVLFVLIIIGLGAGLYSLIKIFALPILLVVGIIMCALRSMMFSGWMPRALFHPGERPFTALTRSFPYVKRNFKGLFKAYLLTFSLSYLAVTGFGLPTFGVISLLVPAIYYFILRTVELVGYYKLKGLCFYTDASTVINTVEFGYRKDNQDIDDDYPEDESVL